jgi:AmmeMemoRadiSam system protein A
MNARSNPTTVDYFPLLQVARQAISAHLNRQDFSTPQLPPALHQSCGVFVTLFSPGRKLRGCIGHLQPVRETLAEEVADCAVASAVKDPRFPPVAPDELNRLELEISLLHPGEQVASLEDLDPDVYGVVVSNGPRRGVLLPQVDGVFTADQQVQIAKRKGGIAPGESFDLERFKVTKIKEPERV